MINQKLILLAVDAAKAATLLELLDGFAEVVSVTDRTNELVRLKPASMAEQLIGVFAAAPRRVFGRKDLTKAVPGFTEANLNNSLGRLVEQGKIKRVEHGYYRFNTPKPAEPLCDVLLAFFLAHPGEVFTTTDIRQHTGSAWANSYYTTTLKDMASLGQLEVVKAGTFAPDGAAQYCLRTTVTPMRRTA